MYLCCEQGTRGWLRARGCVDRSRDKRLRRARTRRPRVVVSDERVNVVANHRACCHSLICRKLLALSLKTQQQVYSIHTEKGANSLINLNYVNILIVFQVFYSDRLHYYPSKEYATVAQYGNDKQSLENQIKDCVKSSDRCCLELDERGARAISVCRVLVSEDGTMQAPTFDIRLMATNPYRNSDNEDSFCAQGNVNL